MTIHMAPFVILHHDGFDLIHCENNATGRQNMDHDRNTYAKPDGKFKREHVNPIVSAVARSLRFPIGFW